MSTKVKTTKKKSKKNKRKYIGLKTYMERRKDKYYGPYDINDDATNEVIKNIKEDLGKKSKNALVKMVMDLFKESDKANSKITRDDGKVQFYKGASEDCKARMRDMLIDLTSKTEEAKTKYYTGKSDAYEKILFKKNFVSINRDNTDDDDYDNDDNDSLDSAASLFNPFMRH